MKNERYQESMSDNTRLLHLCYQEERIESGIKPYIIVGSIKIGYKNGYIRARDCT